VTKKICVPCVIVLLFAICSTSAALAPASWWRTYGAGFGATCYSVQQTTDGGYVVAGQAVLPGRFQQDVYLIKTNGAGDTLWTRTYGGWWTDVGQSVRQTSDGGYVIAGQSESYGNHSTDVYLLKTDEHGGQLWTRTYGGDGTGLDFGRSGQQTADGGYIVTGGTWSFGAMCQVYLIRTDSAGDTLWTRTYGGENEDAGCSVQQTSDSGYVIAGYSDGDVYLVKTDAQGDTLWTRTYGGHLMEIGYSVQQTSDGGYIVVGELSPNGDDDSDVYLVKTDASGNQTWAEVLGGAGDECGRSVQQTSDGGYVVTGWTRSFGVGTPDYNNVYLIKTDADGDTLWTRTYGGTEGDWGVSGQQTGDGGYIVAGTTNSFGDDGNVYLIKTDSLGLAVAEPLIGYPSGPTRLLVQPNPFSVFARVPRHETEVFVLSDIAGRQVAICKGDRIGEGLRPGVYFLSPVGSRAGNAATTTIVKTAF
jgi:hypothetical protein